MYTCMTIKTLKALIALKALNLSVDSLDTTCNNPASCRKTASDQQRY